MGDINLSAIPLDMILNILNIVLLFLLVRSFVYKPVRKFMDARTERVNAAEKTAGEKAAAADAVRAEYETKMASADAQCAETLETARRDAQRQADAILADAQKQADAITADAEALARQQRADALKDMQSDVVDLAFGISEKLLERSVRDADTEKMADRLFTQCLEKGNDA